MTKKVIFVAAVGFALLFVAPMTMGINAIARTKARARRGDNTSRPTPSPSVSPLPPPLVAVSLERAAIREGDHVPVSLWLANQGDQALTDVEVDVTSPSFITLSVPNEAECGGKLAQTKLIFGNVPPNSSISCKLSLGTKNDIVIGDYSLSFTFQYQWKVNDVVRKSFVTAEKPLKVTLLGTDSVAGVPLALAGFIVPGLFFWIGVRLLKVPWGVDVALGDKTVYSVVISSLFMAIGAWYDYLDLNNGIGLNKLMKLAGAGFVLGVLIALAYHLWKWWRRRRLAADRINFDDDEVTILGKALSLSSRYNPGRLRRAIGRLFPDTLRYSRPRTRVKLKNDKMYVGSFALRSVDNVTLIGWFKIVTEGVEAPTVEAANKLGGNMLELFKFARDKGLTIKVHDAIKESGTNLGTKGAMQFENVEVVYVRSEVNKKQFEPLSIP